MEKQQTSKENNDTRVEETLPSWLFYEENYKPPKDEDHFIQKSILSIMGAMSQIRMQQGRQDRLALSPSFKLAVVLYIIVLMAFSRNSYFEYFVITGILLLLCTMDGRQILSIAKAALLASLFAAVLLLPAILLYHNRQSSLIVLKVFASVSMISILSRKTQWNQLTAALRRFHVPAVFVLTLDLTLKYIVMLGELCVELLTALRVRSIGKNNKKYQSLSGILGVTFMKSKEMSEEMYQAMICRGFTGDYVQNDRRKTDWRLLLYVLIFIGIAALFWATEIGGKGV